MDGTLINSEGLGTEAYNYGIQKVLNREMNENEKLFLLGIPFKALDIVFPFLSSSEKEKIIEETLVYYKKYNHLIKEYPGIREMIKSLHAWAVSDFGKPGMALFAAEHKHAVYAPYVEEAWLVSDEAVDEMCLQLRLPEVANQQGGAPARIQLVYRFDKDEQALEIQLTWFDKPASRLPEALWFSFIPKVDNPNRWRLDKLGERISPLDVVKDGSRNLHAVNAGIFYNGADGKLCIETLDAALVAPGEPRLLQFDNSFGLQSEGMHFQLYNNVWGTNFPMWYEEDACFRFVIKFAES
ncbi:HAD hydrolase-like protein [Paenibacillus roseipurpureus]|uniref:HAD hydrolase-like protein n=1 Tax=Paenibacillus roseopurpureus TaxID=2918901 RepID=A0AA96RNB9_9BACL|nr:HAD hydrolase-like protein [Paenibacillus sp. MBLB1832]WNR45277.1 HAD hydrolase-like protein [Paenibacillus sp. MBLB1832]